MPTDTFETDLHPSISEEAFQEAKAMTGVEMRTTEEGLRRRHCWNKEAAEDNIRHFAHAYGDTNPLFTDPKYAKDTVWGDQVAPPTWLYTVDRTHCAPKLPGVQWIHGGNRFEFERPVTLGDRFHVSVKQTKCERKQGSRSNDMVLQEGTTEYYDQNDELVATALSRIFRIPRPKSSDEESSLGQERELKTWSDDELMELEDQILDQTRRGDEPRYWDTVNGGDELEPRIKGPLSLTDILCWYAGYGTPFYNAHEMFVRERQRHPGEAYKREDIGIFEHPALGHLDPTVATGIGVPRAYDIGPQRITWLAQVVSDWMGDDGMMKMIDARLKSTNYIGDVTFCRGEVVETYVDEETDEHLVDVELWGENQDDEVSVTADCTVRLPTS
jgi:acyl dehydratase